MKEKKSVKFDLQQQHDHHYQNGHLSPFKFTKLLDPEASWDKLIISTIYLTIQLGSLPCIKDAVSVPNFGTDQLGDVLHWIRQVVALVCGMLWGAIPLVGGVWIVVFLMISSGIVYGYYAMTLKIDEEDFGGHGALLQEGLFASITLFLLAWIVVYSLMHF